MIATMMEDKQGDGVEYNVCGEKFSKSYEKAMLMTLKEIKDFCVQIATAYSIINMQEEQNQSISSISSISQIKDLVYSPPQIKAVVYSPTSDTYYIHSKDFKFIKYLLPRLQKFFTMPQFGYDKFKIEYDFIDNENFSIEVNINDESTILNNAFFNMKPTSI